MDSNFYAQYTYGNRTNRGIKFSHWNAGSAYLENKIHKVEQALDSYHSHILGVSEVNLNKYHDLNNVQIDNYDLITCETMNNVNLQYSSVVVYKHYSIIAKVLDDLMSPELSPIWLECGLPMKRKFLVCNMYCKWHFPGAGGGQVQQ